MSIGVFFSCCRPLSAQENVVNTTHTLALDQAATQTADDAGESAVSPDVDGQLLRAVQNPVARLISIPVQGNSSFNVGPYDRTQNILNIQPVIPLPLSQNWNLVARIVQPIVWQPYSKQSSGGVSGFGDMNPTFYLAAARPARLIWSVGPTFLIPTATHSVLGQGKLGVGPSILVLTQPGSWTLGVQINEVWSVAGRGSRPAVNQMMLQYFANCSLKKGWYIASSPTISANWLTSSKSVWTTPFAVGIGRVTRVGSQTMNLKVQFFGDAVYPSGTSPWKMQTQVSFLFRKLSLQPQVH
jgi:hypothetical protein